METSKDEQIKVKQIKWKHDMGQGLVEYVLIIVLVSVSLLVALTLFGGGLANTYSVIVNKLP